MWTLLSQVPIGGTVKPDQRLPWLQTTGIGMQHVIAMFGATFLVPLLTGFPPTTTVFFSGVGTIIFLIVTRNKIPSYLGSSFAFIAPVIASMGVDKNIGLALGGIVAAGLMLFLVGLVVNRIGHAWINALMPPAVTGAIVMLIGLNLAPVAVKSATSNLGYSLLTIIAIVVIAATFNGFLGRISIFLGVVIAWIIAALTGGVDPKAIEALQSAAWFGWPEFHTPQFALQPVLLMIPVVIVLIAENTGHVKAVAEMTGESLDGSLGRAYMGDGIATMVAGFFGGSGTTTYAENIGVMAATRVYSTAAYFVAASFAIVLGMCPKFGALILTLPVSVLGGVTVILYGLIAVLGGRIWIEGNVDFRLNQNLFPAAIAVIVGAGDFTWAISKDLSFGGIALGTAGVLVCYHLMRWLSSTPRAEKRLAPAE
ncbi:solute carrier family 23 protein [Xanthobacteraceae bacterium Astr-EGSB]|uniref:uracil-xanthine permease family protein n=1 Tax=Astrobacterium formosum TaxID=3069710 RepID=UPI0027B1E164|nr:solute carrier family 23 protein [Xanthobacteraceae bacterium Astr-EGSB]